MAKNLTYEELEQKVKELEKEIAGLKEKEDCLCQSNADKQALLDAVTDVMLLTNPDGTVLVLNKTAQKNLGTTKKDFIGTSVFRLLPADVAKHRKAQGQKVIRSGKPHHFVDKRKDRWFDQIAYPIFDSDRKVVRLAIVAHDVTNIKREEELLQRSHDELEKQVEERTVNLKTANEKLRQEIEERKKAEEGFRLFKTLIDQSNDAIYVLNAKRTRFLEVNARACSILGHTREELLNVKAKDIKAKSSKDSAHAQAMKQLEEKGYAISEMLHRRKDGSTFPVEISIRSVIQGNKKCNIVVARDISERKLAEEAIRQSEEMFRSFVQALPDLVFIMDEDGRYVDVLSGKEDLLYKSTSQVKGRYIQKIWPKEVADPALEKIRNTIKTGKTQILEYKLDVPAGLRWFEGRTAPLPATRDDKRTVVWVARDITDRKQMEQILKESEEKFRTLAEQSPNMIFINKKGMPVYANKKYEEVIGYKREELYTKKYDFLKKWIAPEYRELVKANFDRHMKGEEVPPYEYAIINKKGKRINTIITPKLISYEGESALMGIITDITELRRSQEALEESEERYKNIFNNDHVIMLLIEPETADIVDANPAACSFYGYSYEELTSKAITDINVLAKEEILIEMERAKTKKRRNFFFRHCLASGEIHDVEVYSGPIRLHGKQLLFSIIHDITEKKQLEAQLLRAQKMESIGTLGGGIAHDFNNLLMGIQGNVSLMMLDFDADHPNYKKLKNIEQYIQDGAHLTQQLLSLARGGKYEVKSVDLNDLVENTTEMFSRTKKEITIHKKYNKALWAVEADQGQIRQALLNLYVNAWQAMPGGGELYLQTENVVLDENQVGPYGLEPGQYVTISVTDTGIGMDEETQEKIFDPFFTTKEMGRGTGLGLSSVYGIIRNHYGFINVYSKKGQGTTFDIYLPASGKELAHKKRLGKDLMKGQGTILLVDDEEMILEVGEEMLKRMGYTTFLARSGKEASEIYKQYKNKIDLVILDMIMPEMGGGETFNRIKEINPNAKVLLSSGYSIDGQAKEILERGCNGFLQKPFDMKKLSQKIRGILDTD